MGKKPFSAKQKREQLRAKRTSAADAKNATSHGTALRRKASTAAPPSGRAAHPPMQNKGRYRLQLGVQTSTPDADRALAHVPVRAGDDALLSVMDPRKVRPDSFCVVPRRPSWSYEDDKATVDVRDCAMLDKWIGSIKEDCYFERNLETWRQLWRVIELSDVLVLVVDARFAALHFVPDLYRYVKEFPAKQMIIALNKCDLVSHQVREAWCSYFESNFDVAVATFSSFPDVKLVPQGESWELMSKRERRMQRSKLAAWGADKLVDAISALPLSSEKQAYLSAWRDTVRDAHAKGDGESDALDDEDGMNVYENSRICDLRSVSPVSDAADIADRPQTNKEKARAKKSQRRKRRRGKPDVALIAAAAARAQQSMAEPNPSTYPDTASVVSNEDEYARENMISIGMVGHPNTGKSSMINGIFRKKVVSTSRTPGHTKHFQTMFLTHNVRLVDCPGLVFPARAPKELQILAGMFPISQVSEPYSVVKYLADRVALAKMLGINEASDRAKLREEKCIDNGMDEPWTAWTICEAWALKRGFRTAKAARLDVYRAANSILRLALDGRIVLSTVPPQFHATATTDDNTNSMLQTDYGKASEAKTCLVSSPLDKAQCESDEETAPRNARPNAFLTLEVDPCNIDSDEE